jgi:transcriptional regulator with XRE-family HTH domain
MQWGLSQRELASLLGISESALSFCETQSRQPTVNVIVGAEVIFSQTARETFPALYAQIERDVMRRAAIFSEQLEKNSDKIASMKQRLLDEMITRSEIDNKHL